MNFLKNLAKLAKTPLIQVKLVKSERQSDPLQIPNSFTKELAEWLGLFVADGHIKGKKGGIYLYNNNDQILQRFSILTGIIFSEGWFFPIQMNPLSELYTSFIIF